MFILSANSSNILNFRGLNPRNIHKFRPISNWLVNILDFRRYCDLTLEKYKRLDWVREDE